MNRSPNFSIPNPNWIEGEDNGEPETILVFGKYEVCPTCEGKGSHSNHLGAITGQDLEEMGRDWLDDYMAGHFDKQCERCEGLRVVSVVDREANTPEVLALYDKWEQEEAAYRYESWLENRILRMMEGDY